MRSTSGGGLTHTAERDVVGIGFGPSNLALAIAIEEHNEAVTAADGGSSCTLSAEFFERQPRFGWHRGMLIDDATMQVSFLKDLVTMRNPHSDYSFVSYLHDRGRLADFINHKTLFPLRIEFHDYLEWAAERLEIAPRFGHEVTDVRPVLDGGRVVAFDVVARSTPNGPAAVCRGRNVVVAVGLVPSLPPDVELGERIWHNLDLLERVRTLPADAEPQRFVVVGAGQSAAEVVAYLHSEYPTAEVCSVFARYGYTPSDDTPFANRIFDPEAVDVYFGASDAVKRRLFDYHRNTNYSVVDEELILDLYRREYQEKVQGRQRLRIMNASAVREVQQAGSSVKVRIDSLPTAESTVLEADAVVFATGYRPGDGLGLLGEAGDLVRRRPGGEPEVGRDYKLALASEADAAIYLQGGTEHAHGITSTLLSNVAVRSGEIVRSVAATSSGQPRAAMAGVAAGARP